MLIYSIDNKQEFSNDLSVICGNIHDSICTCFRYDRDKQEVCIYMDNKVFKTKCQMMFYNVKLFFSTNFDVWGVSAEMINGIGEADFRGIIKSLNFSTAIKQAGGLQLEEVEHLLGVQILFRTGNEVFILCERISIEPNSIITKVKR